MTADPTPTPSVSADGPDLSTRRHSGIPTDEERQHLAALAARLEELRRQAGLSRGQVSALAGRHSSYIRGLVALKFRPRDLALEQISIGLAAVLDLDAQALHAELVDLAGPALAPSQRPEYRVKKLPSWRPRPDPPPIPRSHVPLRQLFASILAADLLREITAPDTEPGDDVDALRAALEVFIDARPVPGLIAAAGARLSRLHELEPDGGQQPGTPDSRQPDQPGGA